MTNPRLLPAGSSESSPWDQALYAFLVEKGNRSGSRRTVDGYGRMLWPFFADLAKTPDHVTPADVLGWAHGVGKSGRTPSPTTVGARIACLSSFYRFLIRMGLLSGNPCEHGCPHSRVRHRWRIPPPWLGVGFGYGGIGVVVGRCHRLLVKGHDGDRGILVRDGAWYTVVTVAETCCWDVTGDCRAALLGDSGLPRVAFLFFS